MTELKLIKTNILVSTLFPGVRLTSVQHDKVKGTNPPQEGDAGVVSCQCPGSFGNKHLLLTEDFFLLALQCT